MRLPIVTTAWPYHAPEIEYLVEGDTLFASSDDADSYAELVSALLTAEPRRPSDAALSKAPTLADMVARFAEGIRGMLPRRP